MIDQPVRILVVDDDTEQLSMLSRVLERKGFLVETVNSPFGVSNKARSFKPHIILLDVHIPALSGDRLIGLIRKNTNLENTRMVLFSACDADRLRNLALEVKADGWIQKTFNGHELTRQLLALLNS
ncbi:MAG: response regulator [Nannocystaceae bacterium]